MVPTRWTSLVGPDPVVVIGAVRSSCHTLTSCLRSINDAEVAKILIERGRKPGGRGTCAATRIAFIRTTCELESLGEGLLERGFVSLDELATMYDVTRESIKRWRERDLLRGRRVNDKDEFVYEDAMPLAFPSCFDSCCSMRTRTLHETLSSHACTDSSKDGAKRNDRAPSAPIGCMRTYSIASDVASSDSSVC
jgi:hypothetical protein